MKILLETDRMLLRRITEADEDVLFALDNDPDVMRHINGGIPTPRAVLRENNLQTLIGFNSRYPEFGFWAAVEKESRDFLGWFAFRISEGNKGEVSLGYRFLKTAWGRGYATEGSRALIFKGFTDLNVRRFTAVTYEKNMASRRVLEKLGFSLMRRFRMKQEELVNTGTFHVDPSQVWEGDDLEYALEKADWQRQLSDPFPSAQEDRGSSTNAPDK